MDRYERKVIGMCFRQLRQYEDACDLAQEIFLQVFHRIKDFEGRSSFSTWLYRVSLNACYNRHRHLKAKGRSQGTSLEGMLEAGEGRGDSHPVLRSHDPGALKALESNEAREQVRQALEQMQESYRKVVDLVDIEGLSYEEASRVLNVQSTTLRARLFRARKILKDKIVKIRKRLGET
jgi:RNA polymerase sigma-70 factor (ECF subfamily)